AAVGEVVGVVVAGHVVDHHRGVAVAGDVLQIVDEEATGVAFGDIVVVFTAAHVLDLEPHDVIGGATVTNNGGVGLSHVDAGIGGANGFRVLHQDVFRLHRVNAITAAAGTGHIIRRRVALVEWRRGAGHLQAPTVIGRGDGFAAAGPDRAHFAQGAPFHALEF